jgi:hypothetical protein
LDDIYGHVKEAKDKIREYIKFHGYDGDDRWLKPTKYGYN